MGSFNRVCRNSFYGLWGPKTEANICTEVLSQSDKKEIESHGVKRFKPIYIDHIKERVQNPVTEFEIVRETSTIAVVNENNGMGQVITHRSMQLAIDKAKKFRMDIVAVRNSTPYGITS